MKKLLIACGLCLMATGAFAYQNEENGFRDMKWGADLPTEQGWLEVKDTSDQHTRWFVREGDGLTLGSTEFNAPVYGFDADYGLYTVKLRGKHVGENIKYTINNKRLEHVLVEQYGKPTENSFRYMIHKRRWLSERREPLYHRSAWDRDADFETKWERLVNAEPYKIGGGTDITWDWGFGENVITYESYAISLLRDKRAADTHEAVEAEKDAKDAAAAADFK